MEIEVVSKLKEDLTAAKKVAEAAKEDSTTPELRGKSPLVSLI